MFLRSDNRNSNARTEVAPVFSANSNVVLQISRQKRRTQILVYFSNNSFRRFQMSEENPHPLLI